MTAERAVAPGPATLRPRIPRQRSGDDRRPRHTILVAVGTDKHRFDRLMEWLDDWHPSCPAQPTMVIQYGHSRPPGIAGGVPFLSHAELQAAMARATLVVCHGGPATILEARRHGHLPIVVPRDPARLEHVDDHQQLFARRLAAAGMISLCETRAELTATLDAGLARPRDFTVAADADAQLARAAAVDRVGRIVEELVAARPGRALARRLD